MQRGETPELHSRWRAMVGLAVCVVGVGVVSWLVTGGIGRAVSPPTTASSFAGTSPSPFPTLPDAGTLYGVTCVSAGDCWAVGFSAGPQPLIVHYAGSRWAIVGTPAPSSAQLTGVTCVNARDCWAVGNPGMFVAGGVTHSLIEHSAGGRWTVMSTPSATADPSVVLNGVTCASAGDCWAVGDSGNVNVTRQLIEHYTGSRWAVVASPNPGPDPFVVLNGVACVSAEGCWAVGYSGNVNATRPLIEHYTEGGWVIVYTSNPSRGPFVALNGVTCVGRVCWAVGSSGIGNPTLVEQVTGSRLAISANSSEGVSQGVSCASAADCWAVGAADVGNSGGYSGETLIEHYTGTGWLLISAGQGP
jgi:hypothetical protein